MYVFGVPLFGDLLESLLLSSYGGVVAKVLRERIGVLRDCCHHYIGQTCNGGEVNTDNERNTMTMEN